MKRTIFATLFLAAIAVWLAFPTLRESHVGASDPKSSYETSQKLSESEFESLASALLREELSALAEAAITEEDPLLRPLKINQLIATRSFQAKSKYRHIAYFREAGILQYEGPATCLTCHPRIKTAHRGEVATLDDVVNSEHFKFQQTACGTPGTFSWPGWAALIDSKPESAGGKTVVRSEGCGQYQIGSMTGSQSADIDCLICHSDHYDMNFRTVLQEGSGLRWNQDRTLAAAMTVTQPGRDNCLLCHQQEMGGETVAANGGYINPRIVHEGARGINPFTPEQDVHGAAGMICTDCHVPEGHKIPRGNRETGSPGKVVGCEGCHTTAPHVKGDDRVLMNGHSAKLACQACHIPNLAESTVVLRDWLHPVWNAKEGMFLPFDLYLSGKAGKGMVFLWYNGQNAPNALGNNPLGGEGYDPFTTLLAELDDPEIVEEVRQQAEKLKVHYPDLDVAAYVKGATQPLSQLSPEQLAQRQKMVAEKLRPLMKQGSSRLQPFTLFNALMWEELQDQGSLSGKILPVDYYQKGASALDGKSQPRWMPQMATVMVTHGIQREGRGCKQCHAKKGGILRWEALGYPPEKIDGLRNLPELQ